MKTSVRTFGLLLAIFLASSASAVMPVRIHSPELFACLTYPENSETLNPDSEAAVKNAMTLLKVAEPDVQYLMIKVAIPGFYVGRPEGPDRPSREAVATALSRVKSLQLRLMPDLLAISPTGFSIGLSSKEGDWSSTGKCDAWLNVGFRSRPQMCNESKNCYIRCEALGCSAS